MGKFEVMVNAEENEGEFESMNVEGDKESILWKETGCICAVDGDNRCAHLLGELTERNVEQRCP